MSRLIPILNTIQKRNNLNVLYAVGEKGPGNAYHEYEVLMVPGSEEENATAERIVFQKGPRKDPESQRGVLDTDLLEIVRHRLTCFQTSDFATRENEMALQHIEEALLWMNKRVEDRFERGVLGTYEK